MFRTLKLTSCTFQGDFEATGATIAAEHSKIIEAALSRFTKDGKIDGSTLRDDWFPQIKADVFISHSHKDQTKAKELAGYLKKAYGLRPFLDCCVWGYAADLLKHIDNEYCLNPGGETYDYQKRNGSTSHVHMMLATALGEMLDSAECVIFLDTPNSISSREVVEKTSSPWIYYEIGLTRLLRERKPDREPYKSELLENFAKRAEASLVFEYSIRLDHLVEIDADDLNAWLKAWNGPAVQRPHPLDLLYKIASQKTSS
jgi:hypothetical protein